MAIKKEEFKYKGEGKKGKKIPNPFLLTLEGVSYTWFRCPPDKAMCIKIVEGSKSIKKKSKSARS